MTTQPQALRAPILVYWIAAAITLGLGLLLDVRLHSTHWFERSGSMVVVFSALLTYLQFRYERDHPAEILQNQRRDVQRLDQSGMSQAEADRALEQRIARRVQEYELVRTRILMNALVGAGVGELVHAFGSLISEAT